MSAHSILEPLNQKRNGGALLRNPRLMDTVPIQILQRPKALFEDSLLETTSGQRRSRVWATIFSVTMQCVLAALLIFASLWYTEVLPKQELVTMLTTPPPPPAPPPPAAAPKITRVASNMVNGTLLAPSSIPSRIVIAKEPEPPISGGGVGVVGGVAGGTPGGVLGGVLGGLLNTPSRRVVQAPSAQAPKRIRVSQGVTEGMILSRVNPVYPAVAKAARTDGVVVLKAVIGRDGTIQNLQVASGPPLLAPAAIDAVRQWRYRPYLLNGEPTEVETTINVIFRLGQ